MIPVWEEPLTHAAKPRQAGWKGAGIVILSVSRRTDIPNYFSEWFLNRLKDGYLYVRNPMNLHQISCVPLSPDVVDCIVFWTKNPKPLLAGLRELDQYSYYFQFTLTGFGRDIEPQIPDKKTVLIPVFQRLSEKIGKERVIWRYDPILFTAKYTPKYHLKAFEQIAKNLRGYTLKCVVSFVDVYLKNQKNLKACRSYSLSESQLISFATALAQIAGENDMKVATCAEKMDLTSCGIEHNCCIDQKLIERIVGCKIKAGKDKNQRETCGCLESVDVGAYHTCKNGCIYCYANGSPKTVVRNDRLYDVHSPLLCGRITESDKITVKKVTSWKERQLSIWDL